MNFKKHTTTPTWISVKLYQRFQKRLYNDNLFLMNPVEKIKQT